MCVRKSTLQNIYSELKEQPPDGFIDNSGFTLVSLRVWKYHNTCAFEHHPYAYVKWAFYNKEIERERERESEKEIEKKASR